MEKTILERVMEVQIHPIPILITIAVCMCLGAFWYSPKAFGPVWARAMNCDSDMKAKIWHYLGAALVSTVMVLAIASLLNLFKISNIGEGMLWAGLSWFAFVVPSHFSGVIWAKKPPIVYLIDVSYLFVTIYVSTTLLIIWK